MTAGQLSLLDHAATAGRSRRRDPATSRMAGRTVDIGARKREVLDAMRLLGVSCTASEITEVVRRYGSRMESGSVRSRLNQLRADGLVEPVGVRRVPKPVGTGRDEQTWRIR